MAKVRRGDRLTFREEEVVALEKDKVSLAGLIGFLNRFIGELNRIIRDYANVINRNDSRVTLIVQPDPVTRPDPVADLEGVQLIHIGEGDRVEGGGGDAVYICLRNNVVLPATYEWVLVTFI